MLIDDIAISLKRPTLTIALASVFLAVSMQAQNERRNDLMTMIEHNAVWDPAEFILGKLKTNRVVMIADAGHGDPLYYRVVINSLNLWVTEHEQAAKNQPGDLPSKLFLFLEIDSSQANALKHYFNSGNLIETIQPLNFWGEQFTTGTLEFYDNLRTLKGRIDAYNSTRAGDGQISFDIIGPEKVIDLSDWTSEKRDRFFLYERDEYSSARIKELLEATPDAKALIFYGGGHLQRGNVLKQGLNQKSMGHFLAHYLSESFGSKGGVYTCGQVDVLASSWMDEAVVKIGKTFAVENSLFTGVPIEASASFQPYDGAIYYFASPRKTRHLSAVLSENLVDYILNKIDLYTDSTKRILQGKSGHLALLSLHCSGRRLASIGSFQCIRS